MMKLLVLLLAFSHALAHDQQSESEEMSVTDWIFGKHPEGQHLRDVNKKQGPPPPPHPPRPFSFFFSRKICTMYYIELILLLHIYIYRWSSKPGTKVSQV